MTDSSPSIANVLKGTAWFSALSDAELESLAERTLIRSYDLPKGCSNSNIYEHSRSCRDSDPMQRLRGAPRRNNARDRRGTEVELRITPDVLTEASRQDEIMVEVAKDEFAAGTE